RDVFLHGGARRLPPPRESDRVDLLRGRRIVRPRRAGLRLVRLRGGEGTGRLPFGPFMAWLSVWMWSPAISLLFTFAFLLFPDGRLPSRRWRPVARLAALAIVAMVAPVAITAWPIRGPLLAKITDSAPATAPESFKVAYNI